MLGLPRSISCIGAIVHQSVSFVARVRTYWRYVPDLWFRSQDQGAPNGSTTSVLNYPYMHRQKPQLRWVLIAVFIQPRNILSLRQLAHRISTIEPPNLKARPRSQPLMLENHAKSLGLCIHTVQKKANNRVFGASWNVCSQSFRRRRAKSSSINPLIIAEPIISLDNLTYSQSYQACRYQDRQDAQMEGNIFKCIELIKTLFHCFTHLYNSHILV